MIKTKSYSVQDLFLNKGVVATYINRFWKDVFSKIHEKGVHHLMLLVKVEYSENGVKTLGHLRKVNFEDKDLFIDYILERLSILNDSYTSISVNKIVFTYIIKEGGATGTRTLLVDSKTSSDLSWHRFNNMNLPISMEPSEYGEIRGVERLAECLRYFVRSSTNKLFEIDVSLDKLVNKVTLLGPSDLKWTDSVVSEGSFKREIQKSTIYFMDGEVVLRKQVRPSKFFKKLAIEKNLVDGFVTMDIETIREENKLTPYLISAYNGTDSITSYADAKFNQVKLFKTFLDKLLTFLTKKTLLVYGHNLSAFDGVFLLKHLISYGEVKPLYFNGRLMCIELKLNVKGYVGKTIIFKDSYLLLPYSLRTLCETFGVKTIKSYFPFLLSNIYYTGVLPDFKYWSDITPAIYNQLKLEFKQKNVEFPIRSYKIL
jgi:hypothetical protein